MTTSLSDDVQHLSWAAAQLGIGTSTAYRLVAAGKIPGAFRIGAQWRVSVPRFLAEVHGEVADCGPAVICERPLSLGAPESCRERQRGPGHDLRGRASRPAG
jgi:excisionase family DNA binding protein